MFSILQNEQVTRVRFSQIMDCLTTFCSSKRNTG